MSSRLIYNSLSSTALYAVNIVTAFIMSPIMIRALGNRDYGLWELVMSVIGYMGLLDLGIGPALVRFVSIAEGKQDNADLQQTISTALIFFVVMGAIAALMFLMLGYAPWLVAGGETKGIANLSTVFMLLGINAGMQFPLQVFIATLMGVQRHYFINFTRVALVVVRAGLTYYLLHKYEGRGLIIMALLEPAFTAIQFMAFAGAVYLDKSLPSISLSAVSRNKIKNMITFGAKSASMLVASRLQNQSVPLIIGNIIGLGSVVYFVVPNRLVDYGKGLAMAIGFPLTPYFGAAIGRGDHNELLKSWLNTTLALQVVSLAMPVVICFCGETFLGLWIGQEYAVSARIVLYILVVGLIADSLATNAFRMLTAQGKHGRCALIWFFLSAISVPMGIGGAYFWGVAGVAAGTTAVTVMANLATVYLACSVMRVSMRTYFSKTLLRVLLPLVILTAMFVVCSYAVPVTGYLDLALHLILSVGIYLLAVWLFTLDTYVRELLLVRIKMKLLIR